MAFCLEGVIPLSYAPAGVVTESVEVEATLVGGDVNIVVAALVASTRRSIRRLEQTRFKEPAPTSRQVLIASRTDSYSRPTSTGSGRSTN